MLAAIMQPTYFPWLGYFDLLDQVNSFVFLDDVHVSKQSWGVRNRIRTRQGELYLTVPLHEPRTPAERLILGARIDYSRGWVAKHLKSISQAYSRAPFFTETFPPLEALLTRGLETIGELNIAIIEDVTRRLGITTPLQRASRLPSSSGSKDERLVAICRTLGANQYLSPQGSAAYIEEKAPGGAFPSAGIELFYHHFDHPPYPQRGSGFMSHMGIVDLLMNCGYARALDVIRAGRRPMIPYTLFRSGVFTSAGSTS